MKIDWKAKLTSRKFWLAFAGFATGVVAIFTGAGTLEGAVMALGSLVAYVIGEGLTDAASIKNNAEKGDDSK